MRLARKVKMTRACSKHHRHSKRVEVKMKNMKLMPGVDVMMKRASRQP